jgi:hypothetical protein
MSDSLNLLCCLPVFLIWFGPGLLIAFCLVFDGCARIKARAKALLDDGTESPSRHTANLWRRGT